MKKKEANEIVTKVISDILGGKNKFNKETKLIGGEALIDSMKLVELCVALEDMAEKKGFEFNWSSPEVMSKSRSIFRNVGALIDEFYRQSEL